MTSLCIWLGVLLAADETAAQQRLQQLHLAEAKRWRMYLDAERKTQAALVSKPVYLWTNPIRSGGQNGAVYVWTWQGRAVAVGSIFSYPSSGHRRIWNEFHRVGAGELFPERTSGQEQWRPQAAAPLQRLSGAAAPEETPRRRLLQMRSVAREFTARSVDSEQEQWQLRLLPQPIYRYAPDQDSAEVVDGALFAFVTNAGTDPEVVLALEARRQGDLLAWHYRLLRFSDLNLYVERDGREIWSSVRNEQNQFQYNADHTYRLFFDKEIDELPELAAENR